MTLPLDHLTILSRDAAASAAWYGRLLPLLGFVRLKPHIWRNADGLYLQFGTAADAARPYERHGAGLNHLGFRAESRAQVEQLAATMAAAGQVARLQQFDNGTLSLFMPDPDGLRVELSWSPPGIPPVD